MSGAVGTVCPLSPGGHAGAPVLATHGFWLDGLHSHLRNSKFRTFGKESEFIRPAATLVFIEEHPPGLNDGTMGYAWL